MIEWSWWAEDRLLLVAWWALIERTGCGMGMARGVVYGYGCMAVVVGVYVWLYMDVDCMYGYGCMAARCMYGCRWILAVCMAVGWL